MAEYSIRIKKQISTIALDHFVSWINLIIPLEGLITTESINKIMSNKTILWIISKVNDSGILKKAFQDKTTEPIKLILALKNENNSILNSLIQLIKDQKTIQKLSITEAEEHNYIIGNSEFRDTLMAIIEIIFGTVPAQQRYEIDEIFSGKISFREILGKQE
jgi:hypothetical protein